MNHDHQSDAEAFFARVEAAQAARFEAGRADLEQTMQSMPPDMAASYLETATPGLPAPATAEQLADAEAALGRPLPAEVRALLALHDGCPEVLAGRYRLFDCAALAERHALELERAGEGASAEGIDGARDAYFLKDWIPILDGGSGDFLAIDLDPADDGQPGQLVQVDPEDDSREVIAPSLWQWLAGATIGD